MLRIARPFTATLFLVMLLAADSWAQESSTLPTGLDARVLAQALSHVGGASDALLPPLSSRSTIIARGNFGKAIYSDSSASYTRLEDGLYDVRDSSRMAANMNIGEGAGSTSSTLSLCGLVALFSAGNSRSVNKIATAAGNWILETTSSVDFGNHYKATLLESSTPSLCNPIPGSDFTMRVDSVKTTRIEGPYVRDKTVDQNFSFIQTCKVAAMPEPASRIAAALAGEYLDVTCEFSDEKNRPVTTRYAFLTHYRYYLTVQTVAKNQRSETVYSSAHREEHQGSPGTAL